MIAKGPAATAASQREVMRKSRLPVITLVVIATAIFTISRASSIREDYRWTTRGPYAGGPVKAIAIDPSSPATLYAGTNGGIFKSRNSGGTWIATNIGLTDTGVESLVIDPSTPATIFAGTASGVFKSVDGGQSWTTSLATPHHVAVKALAVHPSRPATVYAGTAGDGVFKTSDGGRSWLPANAGLPIPNLSVEALAIATSLPATVYAGTLQRGIFKSTDGGGNWTVSLPSQGVFDQLALAADPFLPDAVYAGTDRGMFKTSGGGWTTATELYCYPLTVDASTPNTIYTGAGKSTDGGANWDWLGKGIAGSVSVLVIDPSDPLTIYVGTSNGVFKSIDGEVGQAWTPINTGVTNLDVRAMALDPTTPTTLYAGTYDGGVFKSIDSGRRWAAVNSGLTARRVLALSIDPSTPTTLYVGTWGGGVFKTTNGGQSWAAMNVGLPDSYVYALAVDPTAPSRVYAGTYSGVFKSDSGGVTWRPINRGLAGNFFQALAVNPVNSAVIYAGTYGNGIFRSTDSGATWAAANTGLKGKALSVYAIAVNPSDPDTLYLGTAGAGLLRSSDGGLTWTSAETRTTELSEAYVTSLSIETSPTMTIYVGTGGAVFRSTSCGGWTAIGGGLPRTYVRALGVDPTSRTVYAGLDILGEVNGGVFRCADDGLRWTAVNRGLSISAVSILAVGSKTSGAIYTAAGESLFKSDSGGWTPAGTSGPSFITGLAIDPSVASTLYVGTLGGGLLKSTTDGQCWTGLDLGLSNSGPVSAIVIDSSFPSTIYAGVWGGSDPWAGGVFRSSDGGANWIRVSSGLTFAGLSVNVLAIDRYTSTVYAGTGGGVFKTTDGGNTWLPFNHGLGTGGLPGEFAPARVNALTIVPSRPATLYAVTPSDGVFKSRDAGLTWTAIGPTPGGTTVSMVASDSSAPDVLYAGTNRGVFRSSDDGQSWTEMSDGLTDLFVTNVVIDPFIRGVLYAGTRAGVFRYGPACERCPRIVPWR